MQENGGDDDDGYDDDDGNEDDDQARSGCYASHARFRLS